MSKLLIAMFAVSVSAIVACSDRGGVSEGDECGGSQDDCGSNLTCTPIQGRGHSFCCPTPSTASNYQNCHPSK
jgi:hypothetical protein